uniref:Glutamine amidotransferase type-2 domain-containing protein n=1 Tax=viral metagenome TaxID=1070528 RepID=A0A6C0DB17_9ZZZZ
MCRLFFSFTNNSRNNEPKRLLLNFFDKCEQQQINDGFGVCWYNNHEWHNYKKPIHYRDDPHIFRKIDNISSRIILAHSRNINKEKVSKEHVIKERSLENTHPIQYKDYLFMHHGDLLLESDKGLLGHQRFKYKPEFTEKIKIIESHIDNEFLKNMKGSTDSELLLFLYLSFENQIKEENEENNFSTEEIMLKSFKKLIKCIEKTNLVNRSNIILAVDGYVLIAKIAKNNSQFKKIRELDLFMEHSKEKEELIVSTIKLTPHSENIKPNTLIIMNHKKKLIQSFKL